MTDHRPDSSTSIHPDRMRQLIATRNNAYAPYSRHAVAALIVTGDGDEFYACNVESAHYKSVCAEAGAISAMVSAGRTRIREVWVLGPGPNPCPPCGDCRQRIHELADESAVIYLVDEDGQIAKSFTMAELLPEAFGGLKKL